MPKAQRKPLLGKKHITDHKFLLTLLAITLVGLSVLALNWNLSYKSRAAENSGCKTVRGVLKCPEKRNVSNGGSTVPGAAGTDTCSFDCRMEKTQCRKECKDQATGCRDSNPLNDNLGGIASDYCDYQVSQNTKKICEKGCETSFEFCQKRCN